MATKYLDLSGLSRVINNLNTELGKKQDTLVSGTSIKTINNTSILGSGNINIDASIDTVTTQDIDNLFPSSSSDSNE